MKGVTAAQGLIVGGLIAALMFASYHWGRSSMGEDIALKAAQTAVKDVAETVVTYQTQIISREILAERQATVMAAIDALPRPQKEVQYVTPPPPDCPDPVWVTDRLRDNVLAGNRFLDPDAGELPAAEPGPPDESAAPAGAAGDHDAR